LLIQIANLSQQIYIVEDFENKLLWTFNILYNNYLIRLNYYIRKRSFFQYYYKNNNIDLLMHFGKC